MWALLCHQCLPLGILYCGRVSLIDRQRRVHGRVGGIGRGVSRHGHLHRRRAPARVEGSSLARLRRVNGWRVRWAHPRPSGPNERRAVYCTRVRLRAGSCHAAGVAAETPASAWRAGSRSRSPTGYATVPPTMWERSRRIKRCRPALVRLHRGACSSDVRGHLTNSRPAFFAADRFFFCWQPD